MRVDLSGQAHQAWSSQASCSFVDKTWRKSCGRLRFPERSVLRSLDCVLDLPVRERELARELDQFIVGKGVSVTVEVLSPAIEARCCIGDRTFKAEIKMFRIFRLPRLPSGQKRDG